MSAATWGTTVEMLETADRLVALDRFGYGAATNPALEAYRALLRAEAHVLDALRPRLLAVAEQGRPAARIYAVLVLGRRDEELKRQLLARMIGSDAPVSLAPGGCCMIGDTVDEVASFLLGVRPSAEALELRRLRGLVRGLGAARVYTAPSAASSSWWARDFAALLAHDELHRVATEIDLLVRGDLPAALYGAVLVHRFDRARGERLLFELTRSTSRVSVGTTMWGLFGRTERVAEIARRWLSRRADA